MVTNEEKIIAIFASNNQTILLYNLLKNNGHNVDLLSAPKKISYGCTKGIRFKLSDIDIVNEEIEKNRLTCKGMYRRIEKDNKISYLKIK